MGKLTNRLWAAIAIVLLGSPILIKANNVQADKVAETKSAISNNKSDSEKLLAQINKQQGKVDQLNNDVSNKVVAIDETQKSITSVESRIKELDGEISQAEAELTARKSVLREQLIELQKKSTNSVSGNVYIDFILNSDDFTDLISRTFAVGKLNKANKDAMDAVTAAKEKLAALKTEQETKKQDLVTTKDKLTKQKEDLVTAKKEAEAAQDSLQKQLDDNKTALAGLQKELNAVVAAAAAKLKAEQEAQAKKAAEAAAAKAAQKAASTAAKASSKSSASVSRTSQATSNSSTKTTTDTSSVTTDSSETTTKTNDSNQDTTADLPVVSGGSMISVAAQFVGVTPYVYGGTTPAGFDCSGLVWYAAAHAGVSLPRTSGAQSTQGSYVAISDLQAGDLVFWGGVGSAYHVGIYIGGGSYIHAPRPGQKVSVGTISGYRPSFGRRL